MVRGKIPNAFKTPKAKFLANPEISAIITIIGCGYGRNFDIKKLRFAKIIFLADADPDGAHIDSLLLKFFIVYMPELIEAGVVYRALPPLFGIRQRNGTMKYFTTKLDFTKYVQGLFAHIHTLAYADGKKLTNTETTNLFYKNIEYKEQLDFVSKTFAVDPDLLEMVLYYLSKFVEVGNPVAVANMASKVRAIEANKKLAKKAPIKKEKPVAKETVSDDEDETIDSESIPVVEGSVSAAVSYYIKPTFNPKLLKVELKKKYKFVDMVEENGVIRIEGLVNSRYQYVFINDKFISACIPIIELIKNNVELFYRVDGELVSLYTLMTAFESTVPAGLVRYKGLGEQNPKDLGVSALRPDGDRTLIRYTMESAKEEIESLRRIDSSMASLLREIKITKNEIE